MEAPPRRTVSLALGRLCGDPEEALVLADTLGVRAGDQVVISFRDSVSVGRAFLAVLVMRLLQLGACDVLTASANGDDTTWVEALNSAWKRPLPTPGVVRA